jgi:hypothetical protein
MTEPSQRNLTMHELRVWKNMKKDIQNTLNFLLTANKDVPGQRRLPKND